ncbi:hypothetical protein SDRG_10473 [Saprolegnia diclina VS20]|uniref:PX domain-containing protein n=1 Tax=Saprolegnia diclina (strain VS20) TaxID=1156394 RepID=T0Q2C7_SAPDV|nr:hypothetical protein SDRG_10473 [Saprolegnia diclina VS20]EQC31959.1 hypothetical protein SDRG_10473 [Saprolegnia diclina VS20]|eukprot:XP_008614687.1 hypothetical protein SDRG_10473 [Saprolegnia diclina VS20]
MQCSSLSRRTCRRSFRHFSNPSMGCQQSTPVRDPQPAPPAAAVDLTNKSLSTIGDALQEDTAEKWAATVQRVKSQVIPEDAAMPKTPVGPATPVLSGPVVVADYLPVATPTSVLDVAIAENDAALTTIADALADDVADKWEALVHEVEISRSAPVSVDASCDDESPSQNETSNLAIVADESAVVSAVTEEATDADEDVPVEAPLVEAEIEAPVVDIVVIDEVEMEVIMIAPLHDGDAMDTVIEEVSEIDAVEEATDNETTDVVEASAVTDEVEAAVADDLKVEMAEAVIETAAESTALVPEVEEKEASEADESSDVVPPMSRSTIGQEYVLDDLIGSTVPVHTRHVAAGIINEIIESAVERVQAKETVEVDIDAEMDAEQQLLQVQHDLAEIVAELEQIKEASEKMESANESEYIGDEIAPQDEPVPQPSDATTTDMDNTVVPKAPLSKAPTSKTPSSKAPSSNTKHYKSLGSSVEGGIVMYNVQVPSGRVIHKRYNDFKVLYSDMAHVMLVNDVHGGGGLPPMPRAGMMSRFTRQNKAMVQEREQSFESILNAIAEHPIASHSPEFQHFLR